MPPAPVDTPPTDTPARDRGRASSLRIGFADPGLADASFTRLRTRIGSAPDNDVVLAGQGVAERHLEIISTPSGWVLHVLPGAERVHVNARPVRERALLRLGDVISVGTGKLALKQPMDDITTPNPVPKDRRDRGLGSHVQAGLRGLSGPLSGQFLSIDPDLQLDRLKLPGCVGCLRLRAGSSAVNFDFVTAEGAELPLCNGVPAGRGRLNPGDQIAWGRHRFVLEMSSPLQVQLSSLPVTQDANLQTVSGKDASAREIWWLLAAAIAVASGIALSLLLSS